MEMCAVSWNLGCVKRVEVEDDKVTIVYRVGPVPFVAAPKGGILQDCRRGRVHPFHQTWTLRYGSLGGAAWSAFVVSARNRDYLPNKFFRMARTTRSG